MRQRAEALTGWAADKDVEAHPREQCADVNLHDISLSEALIAEASSPLRLIVEVDSPHLTASQPGSL